MNVVVSQVEGNLSISGDGHLVVFNFAELGDNIAQVAIGKTSF